MLDGGIYVERRTTYFIFLTLIIIIVYIFNIWNEKTSVDYKISCKSEVKRTQLVSIWNPSTKSAKTAVSFLYNDQIQHLAPAIALLDKHFPDNMSADILIFHTGYPFKTHLQIIANTTKRQIIFYNVDDVFSSFPKGFDPYLEDPTWTKRGKWNYQHMCRFWFKLVLDIPIVIEYDYLMRLDSDSKIMGNWFDIFDLMENKNVTYFGNIEAADSERGLPGLMNLKSFTYYYKEKYRIIPKNPTRLNRAFDIPEQIRLYNTNFDIIKIEFFKRDQIRHWTDAIDETFGIFKYRWGDHVLRYITTALFAAPAEVLLRTDFNLSYCHPC
jgi:hypothetical protein